MKNKRKKILRIRPFNMANFSGGSGYLFVGFLYGVFSSFPIILITWLGAVLPLDKKEGGLDYEKLKHRINCIALPICLIGFVILFYLGVSSNYGSFWAYLPEAVWGAFVPTVGTYYALRIAAKSNRKNPSKAKFLLSAILWTVFFISIGAAGMLLLDTLGGLFDY